MIQASSSLKQVDSVPDLVDNSWCVVSADEFKVRIGPSYSSWVDAFTSSKKTDHIMQHIKPPTKLSDIVRDPQADFWCPNFMVLNVMLPAYPPSISVWSSPKDDGATYSLVIYFGFNQEIYDGMKNEDSNALRLLKKWLQADPQSKDDYEMRGRLKGIPVIQNKEDGNFGLLSSLVNMYNAKPFLTGPKHHRFVKTETYLEVDVDIHRYMYLARSTFHSLRTEVPKLRLNFALVVEGRDDDELPEQILGAVQISKINIENAPEINL